MFEIHSKTGCPSCDQAKAYFERHDLPYIEYRYDDFDERQAMYDRFQLTSHKRTVPQIFLNHGLYKEYIGGYTDLIRTDFAERLQMENFDAEF